MYRIARRQQFGPTTFLWDVVAPDVARAAKSGHFVMVRIDERGERIPLTVADYDRQAGTVTVVVQAVGKTTYQMMEIPEGEYILDFIGPLGLESEVAPNLGTVVLVGGGLGVAPIFPQLRDYQAAGNRTVAIIGFRNKELVFWEDRFRAHAADVLITTDDGSYGRKGLVTQALKDLLEGPEPIARVVAIGPIPMMRACCEVTRPFNVPTIVSLNSIMVDGTGMCGSCRVTVGGKMKFACVDGADFNGHLVNFDELSLRQRRFSREEKESMERYRREDARLAAMPCVESITPMQLPEVLPDPATPRVPKNA
ncbi:MAG: sulfide/dihydroorotate dehydrogenase-like FAD/NAD-binding protein, partial [Bryobacterales bacterium]|nr:sulfide/dihydroorotate dehydrogenase-like FAD/NAD-binding protein [Bryobacterales bacterium]